ncbi:MAG TPA: pyrophosphatase [Candidatus Binatia bacterium]|nr:pyrophosphatase [Candidatus Binatia bacterium]
MTTNRWLIPYAKAARTSDIFRGRPDHTLLIAAGLLGEAGSVLAEVKKRQREEDVYPDYLDSLGEELGDSLWYLVRLIDLLDRPLLRSIARERVRANRRPALASALDLGAAAGRIISTLKLRDSIALRQALCAAWASLERVARAYGKTLEQAANDNLLKTQSRWPSERTRPAWPRPSDYHPLFDADVPPEDQLPRSMEFEFIERGRGERKQVVLRANGINVGSRINDNITDPDHYRYHDIFHLSYAVFLGWSPVIRNVLRCKRKSNPELDENQDGARAVIIDEAISATVFSRAKHTRYFEDATQVDYDLLKIIAEFVRGYEVEAIPAWQWEHAILEGFRVFHQLRANHGGRVSVNLPQRSLVYRKPQRRRAGRMRKR